MKKNVLFFVASLVTTLVVTTFSYEVQAASPTPSASPKVSASPKASVKPTSSPSPSPETQPSEEATTQSLRERIERIVEEKRDQIKGVLSDLDQKKRAVIGEVARVSQESMTIKNIKGTQIISLTQPVALLKKNKSIPIDEVAVGNWVVVMGIVEDDVLQPKRILVSDTTLRPATAIVEIGSITTINKAKTELTLIPRSSTDELTLLLDKNTKYQDISGETIKKEQLSSDMQAVVVGREENGKKTAALIRVLTTPSATNTSPSPKSTTKASPVASPKAP